MVSVVSLVIKKEVDLDLGTKIRQSWNFKIPGSANCVLTGAVIAELNETEHSKVSKFDKITESKTTRLTSIVTKKVLIINVNSGSRTGVRPL